MKQVADCGFHRAKNCWRSMFGLFGSAT